MKLLYLRKQAQRNTHAYTSWRIANDLRNNTDIVVGRYVLSFSLSQSLRANTTSQ
jgi:hypothetical protein